MKKIWGSHITALAALSVFIVLGLSSASTPDPVSGTVQQQQTSQSQTQQQQPSTWTAQPV
jgi:hypothetical protein